MQETKYMRSKWGWVLDHDPYFNPNLSLHDLSITLAFPPTVGKPWRASRRFQEGVDQARVSL